VGSLTDEKHEGVRRVITLSMVEVLTIFSPSVNLDFELIIILSKIEGPASFGNIYSEQCRTTQDLRPADTQLPDPTSSFQ